MIQFLQQRAKSKGTRFAKDRSQSIFIESGSLFLKKICPSFAFGLQKKILKMKLFLFAKNFKLMVEHFVVVEGLF